MLSKIFPSIFPSYSKPEEKLCKVVGLVSGKRGMDVVEFEIFGDMFITIEDTDGARGRLNIGMVLHKDPLSDLKIGDSVVATVRKKELFPLELKIIRITEFYSADSAIPINLVS